MTSNVGARLITEKAKASLGFGSSAGEEDSDYNSIKQKVLGELKNLFRPELLNRIDEIIVFRKLNKENILSITKIMTDSLKKRIEALGYSFEITDAAISQLSESGFDEIYGARPLRRAIQTEVEDLLADEMLLGTFKEGDKIVIDFEEEKFVVKKANK